MPALDEPPVNARVDLVRGDGRRRARWPASGKPETWVVAVRTACYRNNRRGRVLVLFDLDDTLLDDRGATRLAATALHACRECQIDVPEFCLRWRQLAERHFARYLAGEASFQQQRRDRIRAVFSSEMGDAVADELFAAYLSEYEKAWSLFPDVLPCLACLGDHSIGVVSNGDAAQQRQKLSRLGLLERFQCIVLSGELGYAKPDPRIFLRACELGRARPQDTVHVGDRMDVDIAGASRAGLHAIWLNRTGLVPPPGGGAVRTITTLAKLRAALPDPRA
jgi:putative hydrolase of the HAD superfamily